MIRRATLAAMAVAIGLSCKPNTTRPLFSPVAGAPFADLNLAVPRGTGIVAQALRDDSLPLSKVEPRDGIIETPWFDASSLAPTKARILGPNVVQVRAWLDPTKPGGSRVVIETVYRPFADPSVPERELDRQVPADHPIGKRVGEVVTALSKLYGDVLPDSTAADSGAVADTTKDSLP